MKSRRKKSHDWSWLFSPFGIKYISNKKGVRVRNKKRISPTQKRWVE